MKKKDLFYIDKKSNELAYIMAGLVAETNMHNFIFNPVVIYADSGNGKTHLCTIIATRMLERQKKVQMIKADEFVSCLVNRMRNSNFSVRDFCAEFNEYSMLILEDVQYLKDKLSSQKCLVDITESFINSGKQIVFTMNCNPWELGEFDEKLKAKFVSGIQIPILEPSYDFKRRIIKNWSRKYNKKLKKKSVKKIAGRATSVGELLGILKQIQFYDEYYGFTTDKQLIKRVLNERGLFG